VFGGFFRWLRRWSVDFGCVGDGWGILCGEVVWFVGGGQWTKVAQGAGDELTSV
jgi:hypothetical protein